MSAAATLDPTTEADFLRRQIADAEKKLAALNIEAQVERNKIARQREYAASERAVIDTRQRHASLQELVAADLEKLKSAVTDAHQYLYTTDPSGKFVYKGYKASRQHITPNNPMVDPEKRPAVDALAQKFVQSLFSEFQFGERLRYAEAKFAELRGSVYAGIAPAVEEPMHPASYEGEPEPVAAPVTTKAFVSEALTSI